MTLEQTAGIMGLLSSAYPRQELTEATIKVYQRLLADLPYEAVQASVLTHVSQSQYFPTVAEIRKAAMSFMPGGQLPEAGEAWGEVTAQIRAVGSHRTPTFSCNAIEKAVAAVGWRELCLSENAAASTAHFFKIYEAYRGREAQGQLQLPEVKRLKGKLLELSSGIGKDVAGNG